MAKSGLHISALSSRTAGASSAVVQTSAIGRLDARVKIIVTLVGIILAFFCTTWPTLALYCCVIIGLYLLARIPARLALRTAAPLLIVAFITALCNLFFVQTGDIYVQWGILSITSGGVHAAAFYGLRLCALVFCACLLMLTTTMVALTQATEQLLHPLAKLGVPVHELALMAGIALRFLPELALEYTRIRQAQASRCAQIDRGSLRVRLYAIAGIVRPLMVAVYKRSEALALGMDSRCYHGR